METASLDELRRLYDLAAAFKAQAPWTYMLEHEIFGVRNPETGEIGWISVMGHLGEHLALAVYPGSESLFGFIRLSSGEISDVPTYLFEIRQLQVSWEDREDLHRQDLEAIKALGLKFRGRQAWPMFRSFVPGHMPWFVTSEEARFLAVALEQGLEVTRRLASDKGILRPTREGYYLVRTLTAQGWTDTRFSPVPPSPPPPPPVDRQRLAAMRQKHPLAPITVQVDIFPVPGYIQEAPDQRPYLGYAVLVVEASSGAVLGADVMAPKPDLAAMWETVPSKLLDILGRYTGLPSQVTVREKRFRQLLAPVVTGWGGQIKTARRLPALDHARSALERYLGR